MKWHERIHPCTTEWMNQWTNELMNQWINESLSQGINAAMTQWIEQPVKQWINEPMNESNQWINERMNQWIQWIDGSVNQWISESCESCESMYDLVSRWMNDSANQWTNEAARRSAMTQWINGTDESMERFSEPMTQWIGDSVNPWINEWTNERRDGRMDEWMDGWMNETMDFSLLSYSYFFTERPFRWGISSLSYFFSEQPLVWATCALNCLPASSFVASAPQFFSSCSCYTAFSSVELQSRLPGASQHHSCFAARSPANAFCHSQLQTRIARATVRTFWGCSERASFVQFLWDTELSLQSRAHVADLIFQKCSEARGRQFFNILNCKSRSRNSPVHLLPTSSSKSSPAPSVFFKPFEVQIELSLQSCALFVDNFCRPNPKPASTETTLPEKKGFRAWKCFHLWIHTRPNCYTFQLLDDGWLT